jgi:hypothetical protein
MDVIGIIIQLIAGAVGGYGTGRVAKSVSINPAVDAIVGLVGGFIGTWIATNIPGLAGLVTTAANGGGAYVGQGVTGLVAGGILTAIVGAIKNATMK